MLNVEERFWSKVSWQTPNEFGCWFWNACVDKDGYGIFGVDRHNVRAHRWAYTYANGPTDLHVLHCCDRFYTVGDKTYRRCVNYEHLRVGTNADNVADRDRHGRRVNPIGESHGQAKLSAKDVLLIRELSSSGILKKDIAIVFGVSHQLISKVTVGSGWSWL